MAGKGRNRVSVRSDCPAESALVSDSVHLAKWTLKGLGWRRGASAVRYLGVELEDVLSIAEQTDI